MTVHTPTRPAARRRLSVVPRKITPTSLGEAFEAEGSTHTIWSDGARPTSVWAFDQTTGNARLWRTPSKDGKKGWTLLDEAPVRSAGWYAILAAATSGQATVIVSEYTEVPAEHRFGSPTRKYAANVVHASACPLIPEESRTAHSNGTAEGVEIWAIQPLLMISWLHDDTYGSMRMGTPSRKLTEFTEAQHCACISAR